MKNVYKYKKGDIVFIKYPFTNLVEFKVRPALVLRNPDDKDVILLPISTRINLNEQDLIIKNNYYKGKPLPVKSAIRIGKIATIQTDLIVKKYTKLKKEFFKEVQKRLMDYLFG